LLRSEKPGGLIDLIRNGQVLEIGQKNHPPQLGTDEGRQKK